jgi:hypothetical protein
MRSVAAHVQASDAGRVKSAREIGGAHFFEGSRPSGGRAALR